MPSIEASQVCMGVLLSLAAVEASTFDLNRRKGRYGVAYLKNVCAQFGVGLDETSADEDVNAWDCAVKYVINSVPVQIKCTSSDFTASDPHLSWPIKPAWRSKWSNYRGGPAYFLVVRVPSSPDEWIQHDADDQTLHQAAAYWARIDAATLGSSIRVNRANRFTAATLQLWHDDMLADFGLVTP
ncbi:DUF4365 domain-containing protein (plasmid) [Arthrobacter sp. G.S.26]|uniref:DUF4365 domain-containing protein n=1 Tax=Arthrobacter sp. G.S.26 TaxID=3433706 RepID=UPI003D783C2F